ncbi:TMEM175 family protein [Sphingomonas sp.]|uniref:TMEM175 family protein n=1 Tax=Sphingomonas sp. TaxID=28214 RepID=UPI00286E7426|nr:TMEM175 family protein [Sphingomonas sp.]
MKPDRLNAFTDGVIAIIITIMVLELRLPEEASWHGFLTIAPFLGVYALSFVNIGIFWNNHHHMLQAARVIDGRVLWANLALLFWLSLVPYEIRWMGEAGIVAWPVATYGGVLLMAAVSYLLLERAVVAAEGEQSTVKAATGSRWKEWLSIAGFATGCAAAFVSPAVSVAIYVVIALLWFTPDRRFERSISA